MSIAFACPGCRKQYRVPDEFAGRPTKCKQCGTNVVVPAAAPADDFAWQPAVIAGTLSGLEQPLFIVHTKMDVSAADFTDKRAFAGFKESTAGKFTMYEGEPDPLYKSNPAFAVPRSRWLLIGYADVRRSVLERD